MKRVRSYFVAGNARRRLTPEEMERRWKLLCERVRMVDRGVEVPGLRADAVIARVRSIARGAPA